MFERYAIFYTPADVLADFGAAWLGWDSAQGCDVPHLAIAGVDVEHVTATPRKYGLHGTLKAPFRLAQDTDLDQLQRAAADFATQHASFDIGTLEVRHDNGFLALRPKAKSEMLQDFAAATVTEFDPFRAPLSEADLTRRRKALLNARQDQQLLDWGYPFVFDDFHFHLTLSGQLSKHKAQQVITALHPHIAAVVPHPFVMDAIALMGQDQNGMFHQIQRYALTG
jgi:putative phosphonate metabolism protein